MKPVVLCSIPESPFITHLGRVNPPVDILTLLDRPRPTPVVYVRGGYETELNSSKLLQIMTVEDDYRKLGAKIVNPLICNMNAHRKDCVYAKLDKAGVPIPNFWPQPTIGEMLVFLRDGGWSFPFIYRVTDGAGTKGTYVIYNIDQLEAAYAEISGRRSMMVEFIDTRQDRLYRAYRAYVIGGKLDMYSMATYQTPLIRWENVSKDVNVPLTFPKPWANVVIKVGEVLGLQIYRVDLVVKDKQCFVVDVNPTYFFTPDPITAPDFILQRRIGHLERLAKYLYKVGGM